MVDSARLKAQIILKGKLVRDVRNAVGISTASWHNRMHGKVSFTLEEVAKIAKLLELSQDDIMAIFFANEVS